ncbi:hypothetical protein Tco_1518770 [Tanacetum coccineum]
MMLHMMALSTTEATYMTLTEAAKETIWLKGLAIESGFKLKIVAGIATDALSKAIRGLRFQHRLNLQSIGSLCPPVGEALRFLQLYIYDTENEVENRMRHFRRIDSSHLDTQIVEGLIHFLDMHNELVQIFRTERDKCKEIDVPKFKIRLYKAEAVLGYELPTSNTLGVMVF